MFLNIHEESTKLIEVINDNEFAFLEFTKLNTTPFPHIDPLTKICFLWKVLTLTIKYPQVETYLKNLLNYFTTDELENIFNGAPILFYMCRYPSNISLNAFEIIINSGININIGSRLNNISAHILLYNTCNNHNNKILNLLIKYSINLNIINYYGETVLDTLLRNQPHLDEETKNCVMAIIDFGGITNNQIKNVVICDFIEYYKCSSIKPAIKNDENKI